MDRTSQVERWVSEMREYAEFLDSEMRRVRKLLNAADGVETRTDTTEILLEVFRDNPQTEFTATDAESEIRDRGWDTESADPVNAVRAALARLKNSGEIESAGRGRFQLAAESFPAQLDDPWGSVPPAPVADDEPPF